ncbi:hypothetical protein [Pseudoxanthomonas kalamensis]|uniref:hypothetical protein n=1 Tax=Pseudoxanthomonas kalamensis TaxID=289483 RepID=UPI001390E01A|nr:hypothetical protein [Pseudoxanthomonas kalamensis]
MATCETNYLVAVGVPIATFLLGFFASRFSLSKKERLDHSQRLFQNERELSDRNEAAYKEFKDALASYLSSPSPGLDDFVNISTTGDNYFRKLREIGESMLSSNIREQSSRENFAPKLQEAIEKTLPNYYSTLQEIAKKKGFPYSGQLKRKNYEPIYSAVEKFA